MANDLETHHLLHDAITNNDIKFVLENEFEVCNYCFIEAVKTFCFTKYKDLQIIQFLVEQKNVNINFNDCFALNLACEREQYKLIVYLLSKSATIHDLSLCYAGISGNNKIFNLLLDHGADISKENYKCIVWTLKREVFRIIYDLIEIRKLFIPNDILNLNLSFQRYYKLQKFHEKMMRKAANKIYFWWIAICYDVNRECGKRMMERSWQRVQNLINETY